MQEDFFRDIDEMFMSVDVTAEQRELRRQLKSLALRLIPSPPAGRSADGEWIETWYACARLICMFLVLKDIDEGRRPSAENLRVHLQAGPAALESWCRQSSSSQTAAGWYAQLGESLRRLQVAVAGEFTDAHTIARSMLNREQTQAA